MNARCTFEVGALYRGAVRRQLAWNNLDYTETKGWLESVFQVRGTYEEMLAVEAWAKRLEAAVQ